MSTIKIQKAYDYISLITPNSRFTISHSGFKASGLLTLKEYAKNFDSLVDFCNKSNGNFGEIAEDLKNGKMIELFPDALKLNEDFKVGDEVRMKSEFTKKFPGTFHIMEVKKANVVIPYQGSRLTVPKTMLELNS